MHRMTVSEAVSFMTGQDRRHRQQWEMTRELASLVYKVLTGEDYEREFPWDAEREPEEDPDTMTAEELEEQRALARRMEEMVNARGGNL